jgi:hypothetical protein
MDNIDSMTQRVIAALLLGLCCGCSGSSAAPTHSSAPLSVSPTSVVIGVPAVAATINVSNANGPVTARSDNLLSASVSVNGSTVTIVPIASGQAVIGVSSDGSTVSVPLTINTCTPPNPAFTLASPTSGSTGVSTSQNSIVLGVQNLNGYTTGTIPSTIVARVISSNGTDVVTAAPLQVAAGPPGAPAGQYFSFSVPALTATTTFSVQAYVSSEPCLPPSAVGLGSFST